MKTVLQTTSATVTFSPGLPGVGKVDFTNYFATGGTFNINRLMAIVNQTRNTIIYAEAQSGFGYASWNQMTHELTLLSDTSTHAATDNLQIIYDTPSTPIVPAEEYYDPVNKMRVSTPQSLIDTDFEYSVQATKWETIAYVNNRPAAFYEPNLPIDPTLITQLNTTAGQRTVSAECTNTTGITVGSVLFVQDALQSEANGWYLVDFVNPNTRFTYIAKSPMPSTANILDSNRTLMFTGGYYTGAGIALDTTTRFTYVGTTITCTTQYAHGLAVGDLIYVTGTTAATNPPNGAWVVATVPNTVTFTFEALRTPTGTINNSIGTTNLYCRPGGFYIHRAYDGGVQFSCGAAAPNAAFVRQTRRYFRYQSGKGIQFSTGSILRPTFQVQTLSAASTTLNATISCINKIPHGMQPGSPIVVNNSTDAAYNGNYEVISVPNELTFTYASSGTPTSLQATGFPVIVGPGPVYGVTVRLGLFDQQNGIFFEHDGQYTYAVRRNSTQQITGLVNVTNGSNAVVGVNTLFASQLNPGDFIVIKGMSYKVQSIVSNLLLYILPEYRGISINNTVCSKTIDMRIRQDQWNIDKLDGYGPSGYTINPNRMQMFYIDYSWYGAGFIRWGLRAANGNVFYVHKMANNNVNLEAYLRSGNLPARYEENTHCPTTILTSTLNSGATTANVQDTTFFPASGFVKVTTPGNDSSKTIEYIRYNNKTSTSLLNLNRAQPGGNNSAQTFTYAAQAPTQVELVGTVGSISSSNVPPAMAISHWGSSVIMDGRYDNDLNFVFSGGQNSPISINNGVENVILAIRLAPSVDSGRIGLLGVREIINRMQLQLRNMDIVAQDIFRITLYMNSRVSGTVTFANVGGSSLAQVATPATGVTVTGGESIYSFFTNAGGRSGGYNLTTQDLSFARELGNSVQGGGTSLTAPLNTSPIVNMYPDGPDILYIAARNISGASQNITARISWTEAQA